MTLGHRDVRRIPSCPIGLAWMSSSSAAGPGTHRQHRRRVVALRRSPRRARQCTGCLRVPRPSHPRRRPHHDGTSRVDVRFVERSLDDAWIGLSPVDVTGTDYRADRGTGAERVEHKIHFVGFGAGREHHVQPEPGGGTKQVGRSGQRAYPAKVGSAYQTRPHTAVAPTTATRGEPCHGERTSRPANRIRDRQ